MIKLIEIKRIGLRDQVAFFNRNGVPFSINLTWIKEHNKYGINNVLSDNEIVQLDIIDSIKNKDHEFQEISKLILNNPSKLNNSNLESNVAFLDTGEIEVTLNVLEQEYKVKLYSLQNKSKKFEILDVKNEKTYVGTEIFTENLFESKLINDAIYCAELELIDSSKRELALMSFALKKRVHSFRNTISEDIAKTSPFETSDLTKKRASYCITCFDENLEIVGFVSKYAGFIDNSRVGFQPLTVIEIETMRL